MKRRLARAGMWITLALTLLLGGLTAVSLARTVWWSRGGIVLGATEGRLEIARTSCTLARQPIAYNLSYPEGNASIMVAPASAWRPTVESALITVSPGPGLATVHTLWVLYIPLWPFSLLAAVATGALWWHTRHAPKPGHCAACGYDLHGLPGQRCPECGAGTQGAIRKLARLVGRITAEPQRTQRLDHGL